MLVSVVIPTRDRRVMVREAVASACAQAGVDVDIVVVDDGSTDGTADALRAAFSDRIRVLVTPPQGVSAARNAGVAAARGDRIAFLDSDDLWRPRKLVAQLAWLAAHPGVRICQTQEIWIRGGVRVNPCAHHRKPPGDIFAASLHRCLVSPSAVLLDRQLFERVGGFDVSLPACEDYDLWLRIARSEPVGLVDAPLVIRRAGHPDQLSRRYWGMDRFRVAALARLLAEGQLSAAQRAAALAVLRARCAILAAGAARRGRHEEAGRYLRLAAAFEPAGHPVAA